MSTLYNLRRAGLEASMKMKPVAGPMASQYRRAVTLFFGKRDNDAPVLPVYCRNLDAGRPARRREISLIREIKRATSISRRRPFYFRLLPHS